MGLERLKAGKGEEADNLLQARESALAAARAEAAAASNALKTVETGINYYAARKEYIKLKDIAEASDVAGKVCTFYCFQYSTLLQQMQPTRRIFSSSILLRLRQLARCAALGGSHGSVVKCSRLTQHT